MPLHASLLLMALTLASGDEAPRVVPDADATADCVARRLKPFVSPYGIQQAWPVMASPPPELLNTMGSPLSDMGHIADGYQQFLHIEAAARAVYVIEQGGFAGTTKVYGPLPLPRCTPAVETPEETPRR